MSLTDHDVRDLLATLHSAYGRPQPTEANVQVWRSVLSSLTGDELRSAALALLEERPSPPAPADVLRVARDQRARRQPATEDDDPRGQVSVQDGARIILEKLAQKMRAAARNR